MPKIVCEPSGFKELLSADGQHARLGRVFLGLSSWAAPQKKPETPAAGSSAPRDAGSSGTAPRGQPDGQK